MISTNLEGRKALVLGGGKGLGFGVAEVLAAKGAEIILVGRGEETLDAARRAIESAGPVCSIFSADLSDNDSVSRLIRAIEDEHQRIDIVLLNGGGPPPFAASVFDASVWEKQFTSMVLSQMRIAISFLPGMRSRRWGRIIAVSSTSVREPIPGLTASNALRASLAGWAKTLAGEVAADGVTVNLLLPGRFATDRTKQFDAMDAADRGVDAAVIAAESQAEIPAKRYGTPAEFGAVAAFLASDDAAYITGVALPVDGGLSRGML
ncbi:SDR family oxidoreductase [Mesorhizobium sp. M0482]|uniref:SDR family oxidoreductase n=1 Tax=Mesorhizobium sp. M0482 TaxID=2956948 RepID=UPI0033370D02